MKPGNFFDYIREHLATPLVDMIPGIHERTTTPTREKLLYPSSGGIERKVLFGFMRQNGPPGFLEYGNAERWDISFPDIDPETLANVPDQKEFRIDAISIRRPFQLPAEISPETDKLELNSSQPYAELNVLFCYQYGGQSRPSVEFKIKTDYHLVTEVREELDTNDMTGFLIGGPNIFKGQSIEDAIKELASFAQRTKSNTPIRFRRESYEKNTTKELQETRYSYAQANQKK
ncbi:hypothetical protein HYU13_01260 [Candidatus Woesearchaeota archaeon]|nr:hypothetical protein [Candidatus Woesearchaeota archaeon]